MKIFILSLVLGLFSLETMALSCDSTNYTDYIGNSELTIKLIEETGAGCNLTKADLEGADLEGAILWRAKLQKANLKEADLQGADLEGAILWRANLRKADLKGADLQGADLRGANLGGAKWEKANAGGISLGEANFENAIYNYETNFPGLDSLFKKEHNMIEMIEKK